MAIRAASSSGPADQDLIRSVVGGNAVAFAAIVDRYKDRLYNTAYRLIGSHEDARDVLQDVFLKAYENLEAFRGGSSLYTWLFRIAVNTSLSHRRKRRTAGTVSLNGEEDRPDGRPDPAPATAARAEDPADPLEVAEKEAAVQEALSRLDEESRTVIVLRDIQHCDYREIAQILEVPPGTVKSRLHRARLVLREHLRPLLGKP